MGIGIGLRFRFDLFCDAMSITQREEENSFFYCCVSEHKKKSKQRKEEAGTQKTWNV